ncbi:MAG: lysylphosphatidylglycerol synthase domain-containing protein [Sulfolobales archaeon]
MNGKIASYIVLIIGLVVFIFYMYLVGFDKILSILARISLTSILLLLLLMLITILLHSVTWHLILNARPFNASVRLRDSIGIMSLSLLSGYLLPVGAVTDVVRFVLSTRVIKLRSSLALSSIMIHRLYLTISGLTLFLILLFTRFFMYGIAIDPGYLIVIILYVILVVMPTLAITGIFGSNSFMRLLLRIKDYIERKTVRRYRFNPEFFVIEYRDSLKKSIFHSISSLRAFSVALLEWLFLSLVTHIILSNFTSYTSFIQALIVAISIQLVYWIMPLSFSSSIGLVEFIISLILQVIGLSPQIAISFVIIYRFFSFTATLLISYPMLRIFRIESLRDLVKIEENTT